MELAPMLGALGQLYYLTTSVASNFVHIFAGAAPQIFV